MRIFLRSCRIFIRWICRLVVYCVFSLLSFTSFMRLFHVCYLVFTFFSIQLNSRWSEAAVDPNLNLFLNLLVFFIVYITTMDRRVAKLVWVLFLCTLKVINQIDDSVLIWSFSRVTFRSDSWSFFCKISWGSHNSFFIEPHFLSVIVLF